MGKRKSIIIAATGEHYAAAFLSSMGLVVAMPRGGTPSTDLIVTSEKGGRSVSLQVKTGTSSHMVYKRKPENNYWLWDTGFKAMNLSNEFHWYAFVFLNEWPSSGRSPDVFFVPSKIVAKCIRQQYDDKQKRPFFWMLEAVAEQYRGLSGFRRLKKVLGR